MCGRGLRDLADSDGVGANDIPEMQVAVRKDRSSSSYLLRVLFIKPWASQLTTITAYDKDGSPRLKAPLLIRDQCNVEERIVESIWLYDISNKSAPATASALRKPKRIFYVAGGSWQAPPDDAHWKFLSDLVQRLDGPATVTLISCPLAPKSPAAITFPMLEKLYHALSADGAFEQEEVCFAGDSSGGNIVLSLVMHCLSNGETAVPASLVLLSPAVDLSHRHSDLKHAEKRDPLESLKMVKETAKAWSQDLQETDPRLSPALGDVKVLAKHDVSVHGIIAGDDVLSVEAEEFVKDCKAVDVKGRFLLWRGMLHDFPIMSPYKFPESVKAIEWIALALNARRDDTNDVHERFQELENKSLKAFSRHVVLGGLFNRK